MAQPKVTICSWVNLPWYYNEKSFTNHKAEEDLDSHIGLDTICECIIYQKMNGMYPDIYWAIYFIFSGGFDGNARSDCDDVYLYLIRDETFKILKIKCTYKAFTTKDRKLDEMVTFEFIKQE